MVVFPDPDKKQVRVDHPDIVVFKKLQKKTVGIDVAVLSDCTIGKKEYKLEKYQGLKKEIEKL